MVSLVLVSHSRALADATYQLIRSMSGDEVKIGIAAGIGEEHKELGTDAMEIMEAISSVATEDGVLVMMDMGSAVLSTETALDFLDENIKEKVRLCPASFVEGAVAASVAAKVGGSIEDVYREATSSLQQKKEHIAPQEKEEQEATQPVESENAQSVLITIPMPHGLHARPVSKLVQEASKYNSKIYIKDITNGKGPVSIKSITGVIALEALYNHTVEITADGEDASKALQELSKAIQEGLGDDLKEETNASENKEALKTDIQITEEKPIGVSAGIVIAPVFYPENVSFDFSEENIQDIDKEIDKLRTALSKTKEALQGKAKDMSRQGKQKDGDIFLAQKTMLDDPELVDTAEQFIRNEKMQAGKAWWTSVEKIITEYKQLTDANLRQRALDLQDVAHMVLVELGITDNSKIDIPQAGIIVIDDITPGQVSSLDKEKIVGVICLENGQTSHSSILLRSRGIPAIVQAQHFASNLRNLPPDSTLAMDGETGEIWINPEGEKLETLKQQQADWLQQAKKEKEESAKDAVSKDGKRIEIFANVGDKEDSMAAAANNAEGIGLLRTEFMFLHRQTAPTEDEQVETFREILEPMKGKPIIIRTLDAGGDKEIPYLNMPKEANPFLGIRAIRLTLRNPELFQQQLRAILKVSSDYDVRIMFPMISRIEELRQAKAALEKAHTSLASENILHTWPIVTGMMMEVPSAAIMAQTFVPEVDFVSIGTNDLVQYTMAADRGNPELQTPLDKGFDPSVISLIAHIGRACKERNIPMAVCGESAANPQLAEILLGLGVNELSMNAASIPRIKSWIRNQSISELESKAKDILASDKIIS